LEELFQGLCVECRSYPKGSAFIEDPIGAKHMAVGIEVEEIPEGLDGNDRPGRDIWIANGSREDGLKGIPCTTTQIGEESPVI
jgi:hypothetical protein